jgi:biopolymer transport protein ExbD
MRFGKRLQEEEQAIQLAPLIDIVFLTLVFFMTTAVFSTMEAEVGITLPTAGSAQQAQRTQGEIFINIREDNSIVVNNRELSVPELQNVLNRVADYFPGGAVIIRADRDALHGSVMSVLDACKNADIQNVSFAAVTEEEEVAR